MMTANKTWTKPGVVTNLSSRPVPGTVADLTSLTAAKGRKRFAVTGQSAEASRGKIADARHHPGALRQPSRGHAGDAAAPLAVLDLPPRC